MYGGVGGVHSVFFIHYLFILNLFCVFKIVCTDLKHPHEGQYIHAYIVRTTWVHCVLNFTDIGKTKKKYT